MQCRGIGPNLVAREKSHGFSRVAVGTWGIFSSYEGDAHSMFVKSFNHYDDGNYPDSGCSFETFTNEHFLECETLGEIGQKPDGSIVTHNEFWSLYKDVAIKNPKDEKEIEEIFEKYELI